MNQGFTGEQLSGVIPRIAKYAYKLCNDQSAADDLLQDTLARAWRRRGQYTDQGKNSLIRWCMTMMYHLYINKCRDAKRERRFVVQWPADSTGELILDMAGAEPVQEVATSYVSVRELQRILDTTDAITQNQREVLNLVVDASYEEVAQKLNVNVGTVRSRLSRARDAMRAHFA